MTSPNVGTATVTLGVDASSFGRTAKVEIERQLRTFRPEVKLQPVIDRAAIRVVRTEIRALNDDAQVKVRLELDRASADALGRQLRGRLVGPLTQPRVQVKLELDPTARADLQRELDNLTPPLTVRVNPILGRLDRRGLGGAGTTTVRADVDKKSFGDALIHVTRLAGAIKSLALPAAAVGSIPSILGLGAALATAAQSAAILPGVMAAGGFAFGALKIGVSGFGEALANVGDPEKFAEAIAGLSPAAREAALAFQGLRGPFLEMKTIVQDGLFANLAPQITSLGNTYLPILTERFERITIAANGAAAGIFGMLSEGRRVQDIKDIGSNAATSFEELFQAVTPLSAAFLDVAQVGSTFLPGLTAGAGGAAQAFADMIAKARETGKLHEFISQGLSALGDLGQIAGNVGVTLGNIYTAANTSGAGFLGNLKEITGSLRDVTGSLAGQEALSSFFSVVGTVAATLGDTLKAIAPSLATILNNAELAVNAIAPAIAPLAAAAGQILAAMSPLLPLIGEVAAIVGGVLTNALSELMPGIRMLVDAFTSALRPVLPVISRALNQLVDALGPVVSIIAGLLAEAITMIVPILGEMAGIIGDTLSQAIRIITPVLPQLADAIIGILDAILPVLPQLAEMASQILIGLLPAVVGLIPPLTQLLISLTPLIPPLLELGMSLVPLMTQGLTLLVPALELTAWVIETVVVPIVDILVVAINAVVKIITVLVDSFTWLQGIATGVFTAIGDLTTAIWTNLILPALTTVWNFLATILQPAFEIFRDVAGAAWSFFGGIIDSVVTGPIQGAFNILKDGLQGVQDFAGNVVDTLERTWNRLSGIFETPIRFFVGTIYNEGIVKAWNSIVSKIPGVGSLDKITGVLGLQAGGPVPGVGSGDHVPALLEPGEYVVPKPVAKKWGLGNIRKMHAATLRGGFPGLEGMFSGPDAYMMPVQKFQGGGPVENARRVAMSMDGKPYVWGGSGRGGTDCSGYMAYITRALRMEGNPYQRIGTTASMPWSGFASGLRSPFSIGNNPGRHMAGTLAGVNVESGSTPINYGPPASGADSGEFRQRWHLPMAGNGAFVGGGGGGGGGFLDPVTYLKKIFSGVIGKVGGTLGDPSELRSIATNMPPVMIDNAIGFLKDKVLDILDWISHLADAGLDKIKDLGGGAISVAGNTFKAGKDFAGEIAGFLGGLIPGAKGGIVTGPTGMLVGEAGPEAIIPLSRLADIIGNGLKGLVGGITSTLGGVASILPNTIQRHISAGLQQFYISHTGPMQALSTGARYNGPNIPGLEMGDQVAFGRNPSNVQEWLEKIRVEADRRIDTRVAEIKFELHAGVVGSQIELQNWLAQALTNLQRDGRLPASLNQVLGGLQ